MAITGAGHVCVVNVRRVMKMALLRYVKISGWVERAVIGAMISNEADFLT